MSKPEPGAGDVEIVLEGETFKLTPTLQASTFLSRQGGGLVGMVQRLSQMEMDAVVMVVAQGLGLSGQVSKDLPGKIYRTGLAELSGPCITFCNHLMNGGRPPSQEDSDAGNA